jgi:cobalt-zinc-cadmium efflux system membrane fusion protein
MTAALGSYLAHLRQTHRAKEASGLPDAVLLERFVRDRDEAAFEVLVWRHAPLVLGVCRRLLRDEQDAEDVFQATFLVLVRKAGAIGRREVVGSWLYKVAYRAALRCRHRALARPCCEGQNLELLPAPPGPEQGALDRLALDEEISRLPARYRTAVVLCYLEGRTQEEAARQLGCAPSTVAWRLSQARQRLQVRLGERGLAVLPAVAVPRALVESAVQGALAGGKEVPAAVAALAEGAMLGLGGISRRVAVAVVLTAGMLCAGSGLFAWQAPGSGPAAKALPELGPDRLSLRLPAGEVTRLGVRVVEAKAREAPRRRLELTGSLTIDPPRLARIGSRFPGEVIEVGAARVGDAVKKGQVLAVVWSRELGEKKSDLLNRMVKLALEKKALARLEELWRSGAGTEASYRAARYAVVVADIAVAAARDRLQAWKVPEDEIKAVEKEAERIIAEKKKDDPEKEKPARKGWARVELRAPLDGVLVERSVAVGDVLGGGKAAFTVADLRKLSVVAQVAEADLRALLDLQARQRGGPIPWEVRLAADREAAPLKSDGLERIGYLVDPRTGTVVVTGQVDNAKGTLRAGQFVKVTVFLPTSPREVVVPAAALVEHGGDTWVFVQGDPRELVFTQRRVVVVRRGRDAAHVRIQAGGGTNGSGLRAGERVVTEGALELKAELDDLRGQGP